MPVPVPVDSVAHGRPSSAATRPPALSPLADSIAGHLVFHASSLLWLTGASRAGHLVLDLGRVDARITTPSRRAAFREAVASLSPVPVGERFRIHGPRGASDATVTGYDTWSGRIVATLHVLPDVDSLAHRKEPLVVAAIRTDSALDAVADTCRRDALTPELAALVQVVRDSLTQRLQGDSTHLPERLDKTRRVKSSQAIGCFGGGARALLLVTMVAGDYEAVREIAVLVSDAGRVTPIRMADTRFKAHDAMLAFDADGDGIDDLAVKGHGPRLGETAVLRLDRGKGRLERLTGGFAWENF